jgi:hypothetical protein
MNEVSRWVGWLFRITSEFFALIFLQICCFLLSNVKKICKKNTTPEKRFFHFLEKVLSGQASAASSQGARLCIEHNPQVLGFAESLLEEHVQCSRNTRVQGCMLQVLHFGICKNVWHEIASTLRRNEIRGTAHGTVLGHLGHCSKIWVPFTNVLVPGSDRRGEKGFDVHRGFRILGNHFFVCF